MKATELKREPQSALYEQDFYVWTQDIAANQRASAHHLTEAGILTQDDVELCCPGT